MYIMKKRFLQIFLAATMAFSLFSATAGAATPAETTETPVNGVVVSETVEYLPDGNSVVITVVDETPVTPYGTVFTKTGSKYYNLRNKDGKILWTFTVKGTFSVGVSATCTATSHSINIVDTAWQNESASTSRSGNKAKGYAKFIRKVLFVTVETREANVTLTCDNNGNLS